MGNNYRTSYFSILVFGARTNSWDPPNQRSIMDFEDVLNEMMDSSSSSSLDDDDELYIAAAHVVSDIANSACHRGSVEGHHVLNRDRQSGHIRLYEDYFSDNPTYGPSYFRRRLIFSYFVQLCLAHAFNCG